MTKAWQNMKTNRFRTLWGFVLGLVLLVTAVIPFTGFAHSGGVDMDWTVIA